MPPTQTHARAQIETLVNKYRALADLVKDWPRA
jgi:hypothetical protein